MSEIKPMMPTPKPTLPSMPPMHSPLPPKYVPPAAPMPTPVTPPPTVTMPMQPMPQMPPMQMMPQMPTMVSPCDLLMMVRPVVKHGCREIEKCGPKHTLTEVAMIAFLMGTGLDYRTAHMLVESWEVHDTFFSRDGV